MKKLYNLILSVLRYHKRFGKDGTFLLFQRLLRQNQIITFSHPEYLHPVFLRNNTSDIATFNQVLFNQDYFLDFGFEPRVILDCGANIGLAAVYFKNKFPASKIISVEPEFNNFELLLRNTKGYNNVFCLNYGLWNRSTNLIIKDIGRGNWGFMVEESNDCSAESIKAITITDIMHQFSIDYIDILKIDIEGSEKEVFGSNFEEWLPKTKVIIIELHDKARSGASESFYKALSNYNYSSTSKGENIIVFLE